MNISGLSTYLHVSYTEVNEPQMHDLSENIIVYGRLWCVKSNLRGCISVRKTQSVSSKWTTWRGREEGREWRPKAGKWKDEKAAGVTRDAH